MQRKRCVYGPKRHFQSFQADLELAQSPLIGIVNRPGRLNVI